MNKTKPGSDEAKAQGCTCQDHDSQLITRMLAAVKLGCKADDLIVAAEDCPIHKAEKGEI